MAATSAEIGYDQLSWVKHADHVTGVAGSTSVSVPRRLVGL